MAATITHEIKGNPNFLRNPEYTSYLSGVVKSFEDKFKLAEEVSIELEETMNSNPNKSIPNKLEVLEKGKKIKLTYIEARYHEGKGKVSDPPTPSSFYSGFRYYMENTVFKEDNDRFDALYTNQDEE
jgi:hypothetical protein